MPPINDKLEGTLEATRRVVQASLAPRAGFRLCTDAYETSIELAAELQLSVAKAVRVEPVRSLAASWAGATRDIDAAQLSTVRWFLDL
jgi:hypothetical protein